MAIIPCHTVFPEPKGQVASNMPTVSGLMPQICTSKMQTYAKHAFAMLRNLSRSWRSSQPSTQKNRNFLLSHPKASCHELRFRAVAVHLSYCTMRCIDHQWPNLSSPKKSTNRSTYPPPCRTFPLQKQGNEQDWFCPDDILHQRTSINTYFCNIL